MLFLKVYNMSHSVRTCLHALPLKGLCYSGPGWCAVRA